MREIMRYIWKGRIPIDYSSITVSDRGANTNDYARVKQSENLGIPSQKVIKAIAYPYWADWKLDDITTIEGQAFYIEEFARAYSNEVLTQNYQSDTQEMAGVLRASGFESTAITNVLGP